MRFQALNEVRPTDTLARLWDRPPLAPGRRGRRFSGVAEAPVIQ